MPPDSPTFLVAIVGRPNVGKSTLFNRLTRSRRAIVGDEPGITRDRIYGRAEWRGREFDVVDTGGIVPDDPALIPAAVFRQARQALEQAAAVFMVVDGRSELTAPDRRLAQLLRKSGKPLALLVNKIETERQEAEIGAFHQLGIAAVFGVSAEHGRGLDEALDWLLARMPAVPGAGAPAEAATAGPPPAPARGEDTAGGIPNIAIIGRPNVGKSTLLNCLTGEERALVSDIPGTTRDAVDAVIERQGRRYRLIDTAGIRRKGKTRLMAEKLSVVMARQHLRRADLALVLLDAAEGVVALDATIAGYASEGGKSCILVVNKWDLARRAGARRHEFERAARERLKFLAFAPMVFISAAGGSGLGALFDAIGQVLEQRQRRVSTAELNRFLATLDFERAPVPQSRRIKIYYLTQAEAAPPTFVLFVDKPRPLHFSFRRFLENQIRRAFGFLGTPIEFKLRVSGAAR
ncbi:MAG TPA: ribosome biogenesis GTPase Der [Terriglobales bacterium]|nr:ribosome biogenesis GTPase Der [Terriglobales bacterium]